MSEGTFFHVVAQMVLCVNSSIRNDASVVLCFYRSYTISCLNNPNEQIYFLSKHAVVWGSIRNIIHGAGRCLLVWVFKTIFYLSYVALPTNMKGSGCTFRFSAFFKREHNFSNVLLIYLHSPSDTRYNDKFAEMTICLSRNLRLTSNNWSQIMQEYCI